MLTGRKHDVRAGLVRRTGFAGSHGALKRFHPHPETIRARYTHEVGHAVFISPLTALRLCYYLKLPPSFLRDRWLPHGGRVQPRGVPSPSLTVRFYRYGLVHTGV